MAAGAVLACSLGTGIRMVPQPRVRVAAGALRVKGLRTLEICPNDSPTKNSHDYGKAGAAGVLLAASEEEQAAQRFQTSFRNKAIQCSSRMGSASAVEVIRAHCQMQHRPVASSFD